MQVDKETKWKEYIVGIKKKTFGKQYHAKKHEKYIKRFGKKI